MSEAEQPTRLDVALAAIERGWAPVPVPAGKKGPTNVNWQSHKLTPNEARTAFAGHGNIGLILGDPSRGLVNVDLDCEEALRLAEEYLPDTPVVTGRPSTPGSHRWYICRGASTRQFRDPEHRTMIVELRSTGAQTLVGPSVHPASGETYHILEGEPAVVDRAELLAAVEALADAVIDERGSKRPELPERTIAAREQFDTERWDIDRASKYLANMPAGIQGSGGSSATYAAACAVVHGFGVAPDAALRMMLEEYNPRCVPPWSEKELRHKVDDAANKPHDRPYRYLADTVRPEDVLTPVDLSAVLNSKPESAQEAVGAILNAQQLVDLYPSMRRPIICGLLRAGETMNVIAPPKAGKSWLVTNLLLSVATGRDWLGYFPTEQGQVLVLDNELHRETSSTRIPMVAKAMGLADGWQESFLIDNLRGRIRDVEALPAYFAGIKDRYPSLNLVALDAFYRFVTKGESENDNGYITSVFNIIDRIAYELDIAFVMIHHTSKGNQTGKSVTDVGSGAGAQSRAADCHLVLRPHAEKDVVVLDAAVRSWKPIAPVCLSWSFPLWEYEPDLDPADLAGTKKKPAKQAEKDAVPAEPKPEPWTAERFLDAFIDDCPSLRVTIEGRANDAGVPIRSAKRFIAELVDAGLVVHEQESPKKPAKLYRTPTEPAGSSESCVSVIADLEAS